MGASASHPSHDGDDPRPPIRALHVLRVTPGSPASQTDIEPFFDFVVGVDGVSGGTESTIEVHNLEKIVEAHEGKTMNLIVWSSKSTTYRLVPIVPSRIWAIPSASSSFSSHSRLPSQSHSRGTSLEDPSRIRQPSLLGLSMRLCTPEFSLDNVWHILEVLEGSPAESAGLVPYGDWIIGWSGGVLRGENDFLEVVEAHVDKPLRVYVYSYDFDTLREVVLVPNRMWGGEGLLGCGVGFGLLHRIPQARPDAFFSVDSEVEEEVTRDVQYGTQQSEGEEEQDFFVPADDIIDDEDVHRTEYSPHHPSNIAATNHHHTPVQDHNHNSKHIHHHKYPFVDEVAPLIPPVTTSVESVAHPATGSPPRRESPSSTLVPSDDQSTIAPSNGSVDPPRSTSPSPPSSRSTSVARTEPLPDSPPRIITQLHPTPPTPTRSPVPGQVRGQNPSLRQFSGWGTNRLVSVPRSAIPTVITGPSLGQGTDDEEEDGNGSEKRTSNGSMTSVDD